MNRGSVLTPLNEHQSGILAIIRGSEPLLLAPLERDVAGLARARWALMRALMGYQQFKHREIFDPAIAGAVLGDAQRAGRMKRACTIMSDEFRGYVAKWSAADVGGSWPSYQPAALAMVARLRAHIAREREEIEALLERV